MHLDKSNTELLLYRQCELLGISKSAAYYDPVPQSAEDLDLIITKKCWFFASFDDAWAFVFTGNDLKNQHLIFLSDELWRQNGEDIYHTIMHEIGHIVLGHRNSTFVHQTKQEIRRQEKEADEFAKKYRGV